MKLLFASLWLLAGVGYFLYHFKRGICKADVAFLVAILLFAVSTIFEGDVFWRPTWNLFLKIGTLALVIVSIALQSTKRAE